ncbi:ribosome maturation factor RimM [Olivibacter ginsenosidimutans]|uniref:Ribosome maturation factor RimM n=1 Tax=Olivibacter ginsenosidimutans TaxID=1176537 RepID=A0ABP9AK92_9SPHI
MQLSDCFYIGYISKTRGLKGEIQVYFEFLDYEALDFDVVFLELDKKLVPFFVRSFKLQSNRTGYFYLEDMDHIDQAKSLVGKQLYLANEKMPERDPDTFYITDLKGYQVFDQTYGNLGEIIAINEFPQQDIAVVCYKSKELLFPLSDDFIVEIDEESRVLKVDLPEGLIVLYSEA